MKVSPQISVIKCHWFVKMNLHTKRKVSAITQPNVKRKKKKKEEGVLVNKAMNEYLSGYLLFPFFVLNVKKKNHTQTMARAQST